MGCVTSKNHVKIQRVPTKEEESKIVSQNPINDSSIMIKVNRKKSGDKIKINTSQMIKQRQACIDDNYKMFERLGKGAFGSVYKVMHLHSGFIRAMKIIKKDCIKYQDDEKLFLKEIEILIRTDHPNIIKIFEYYQDDVNYYLITEYVSGGELYESIVNWKNFDEEKAGYIMYQILSAVNYLHSLNIVHRDLKPENILVEKGGTEKKINIKLIDFGTCNFFSEAQKMSLKVGTPYYIAPEVLERKYNEKVDIWSCGVILYILLVGYPPFNGSNAEEILANVKKGKYKMDGKEWLNVSDNAKDLVKQMLEYNPEIRVTGKSAIKHAFITKNTIDDKVENDTTFKEVITNIKSFNTKEKFQQATLAYIVHFFYASSELDQLRTIFHHLDINGDGRLTYKEMRDGFDKVFGKQITDIEFFEIIKDIDQDQNGFIEYQEFLRAGLNRKSIITEENLKLAFDKFDLDGDGKLSIEELKNVLSTTDNDYINEVLESFDINKDHEISFQEFFEMMKKITHNHSPMSSPVKKLKDNK